MSGNTLLIVGAGFSKPFGGPLLDEIFSPSFAARSPAIQDALATIAAMAAETDADGTPVGMEAAFTLLWEGQYSGQTFEVAGTQWSGRELLRQLRVHLTSVASEVRLDLRKPLDSKLVDFLKKLTQESRSLTVVSFNYDTLIEDCFDRSGLVYSYGNRRALRFVDGAREKALDKYLPDAEVLKLHGSINWGVCRECTEAPIGADLINAFHGVFGLGRNKSCQFCDKPYLQSSIIPPVETKGAGLQPMEAFWQRARRAAVRAREVLVVGYSLPPADTQAMGLVKGIVGPFKRPRIRIACGKRGAPISYRDSLKKFDDSRCTFEEFLEERPDLD
jgi:NAD-dependent SIR2 family protein deacetylase